MIDKTLTGVSFFDDRYGGTHRQRPMLVCGRSGTGKTVFALQFIMQGLRQDERCLILSAWRANDLIIFAEALGFPISSAIEAGRLIILEYNQYVPGRDKEWNLVLPSEGFLQFEEVIHSQAIQRVVLDTVLPWICIRDQHRIDEHLFSFIRAFDRMRVTTMMTMPKPVSTSAFRVKNTLETLVPVSVSLLRDTADTTSQWIVSKYLGENRLASGIPFRIGESGIVAALPSVLAAPVIPAPVIPTPAVPTPVVPAPEPAAAAFTPPVTASAPPAPIIATPAPAVVTIATPARVEVQAPSEAVETAAPAAPVPEPLAASLAEPGPRPLPSTPAPAQPRATSPAPILSFTPSPPPSRARTPFSPPAPAVDSAPADPSAATPFARPPIAVFAFSPSTSNAPAKPSGYEKGKPIRFSAIMPGLDVVKPIPERRRITRPF